MDREKVGEVWIWNSDTVANCPSAIAVATQQFPTEIPEGEEPGDNITIKLQEYFLGDIVYTLMDAVPGPFGAHLPALRRNLTNLRSNIQGLMDDGVIVRLQLRHDLKRHRDEGGACFYDEVKHRWVCLE